MIFIEVTNTFGCPEIDLFTTRINIQLQNYVSVSYEPKTKALDAFLTDCIEKFSYIFSPLSLLGKVTSKICRDKSHCIVIIPKWTTQYWYSLIMEMPVSEITIKPAQNNLLLPQDIKKVHPLHKNLTLSSSINTLEI